MKIKLALFSLLVLAPALWPQGLAKSAPPHSADDLSKGAWPTYHGDFTGRRFSPLKQIDRTNVGGLALAWVSRMNFGRQDATLGGEGPEPPLSAAPPTNRYGGGMMKATPLVVDGVIYFSSVDHAWAVDARTGAMIWHFYWKTRGGIHIGNRGMGISGQRLFFLTPDDYLVSLDAVTGQERWHKQIADVKLGYFMTGAPVVVREHVIYGTGSDEDVPAWLESRNAETGELEWKWYSTPRQGEPGSETWPDEYARVHGGGQPWAPGTYDPDLNLYYIPTGNPNPIMIGDARKGTNLWTASIVALNPDTGKMAWYFQCSPHDTHDWDATQVPVLFDAVVAGKPRMLVAQASRNGMFFVLDRATGEHLFSAQYAESPNWSEGFTKTGEPIPDPAKEPQTGGSLVSPSNGGISNWAPPTFSPETGLFYVNVSESYSIYYRANAEPNAEGAVHSFGGAIEHGVGGIVDSLRAIDYKTGKAKWIHNYSGTEDEAPRPEHMGGLMSTAGGLVFGGGQASSSVVAYDASTGRILWHSGLHAPVDNAPATYMLDGRQYIIVGAGDSLYAFALQRAN
jgi:alcohol dehydrogenase (cytochrome c)